MAAMADSSEDSGFLNSIDRANDRPLANTKQASKTLEPGITLTGSTVVVIEQRGSDGAITVAKVRAQIDRLQTYQDVARLWLHRLLRRLRPTLNIQLAIEVQVNFERA